MRDNSENPLCLTSLHHISIRCYSVEKSLEFYQYVLGFSPVKRPGSFKFHGAWLFNHGLGIGAHLVQTQDPNAVAPADDKKIDPFANHISFLCESLPEVERKLNEMNIKYMKTNVTENGITVDQLFFHDPDGLMIEICTCDNLPQIPLNNGDVPIPSCPTVNGLST